jgi:hypothetical protein
MDIINEAIKCPICKKILESPVFLPCGESVCKSHVDGKTQIFCISCEDDHSIPNSGLTSNKKLEKIIQNNKENNYNFGVEYNSPIKVVKTLRKFSKRLIC